LTATENWLWRLESAAVIILFPALVAICFLQVVFRYVLSYPLEWTEELAVGLFIWLAFVGSTMAVAAKGHFALELMKNRLPATAAMAAEIIIWLVSVGLLLIVTIFGVQLVLGPAPSMTTLPVSMRWFSSAVPIGGALMLVHLGIHAGKAILARFASQQQAPQ
jgi:TRAP-type C4-dicarboxylate transport system permease small subunit